MKNVVFWLNCSRAFSLPITVMSWLVVFLYAMQSGGNVLNGVLALIGVALAHLAGNLTDDYIDYGILSKDEKMMNSAVKTKCCFIRDGSVSLKDILKVIILYSAAALLIGVFLFIRSGEGVIWLTIAGGILTLTYARFSMIGMSEVIIGLLFGPLIFEGIYYVMKKTFSFDVLILSIAVVMFTLAFLYVHTLLDFDSDQTSHKRTLCCRIGDKNKALFVLAVFYTIGYLAAGYFGVLTGSYAVLISFLTIPMAFNVFKLIKRYNGDKTFEPVINWYNQPLDNWDAVKAEGTETFYFVLFQARNLMMWFCVLFCFGILLKF